MSNEKPSLKELADELACLIQHNWWYPHGKPEQSSLNIQTLKLFHNKLNALAAEQTAERKCPKPDANSQREQEQGL